MATKTVTGLPKNTEAAVAVMFSFTVLVPLGLLLLEKDSYIRFHSMQALLTFVAFMILVTFSFIFAGLVMIVGFGLWLFMIYKAWQGEEWEVPFIGKFSRTLLKTKV